MNNKDFKSTVEAILAKHNIASLYKAWEQAISLEPKANIIAYWIRDSDDVINIVWLTPLGIYDISQFTEPEQSAFNYVPLQSILSFEVRRLKNVAHYFGHTAKGDMLITAYCQTNSPNLLWVADTQKQTKELESFFLHVFASYYNIIGKR